MKLTSVSLILACAFLVQGCIQETSEETQQRLHRQAVADFAKFAPRGRRGWLLPGELVGEGASIKDAFSRCFRKGAPASDFGDLFASAKRIESQRPDGQLLIIYSWRWQKKYEPGEGDTTFEVVLNASAQDIEVARMTVDWSN